jgi:hypothetical protein
VVELVTHTFFIFQSEVSERSSRNPEMLHATNAAAALRIAESGSSSSVNKRSIHEGAPSYDLDGPQPKKRCLNRIVSQQAQILERYNDASVNLPV